MINGRKCLAIIVARGGSKGLPGKNIADLGGEPLVAWSVSAAKSSKYIDRIILSSDDENIIEAAQAAGCETPFRRPAELANDEAPVSGVIIHALDALDEAFDYLVLLQATSPLRTGEDIDGALEACDHGASAVVSVTAAAKPPEWLCTLDKSNHLTPIIPGQGLRTRRQDLTTAFMPNGAVYAARTDWFRQHMSFYSDETVGFVMPAERSVDIDGAQDLMVARWLVQSHSSVYD